MNNYDTSEKDLQLLLKLSVAKLKLFILLKILCNFTPISLTAKANRVRPGTHWRKVE